VRFGLRGVVVGVLAAVGLHFAWVLLSPNFHTVLPGAVYRSGQPSPARLERLVRELGIRTVVNLRGCCPEQPWYRAQCEVVNRLGIGQEDLGFSAGRLPSTQTMRQLIEVLDRAEYPILLHCHQGADRTGMAAVAAVILRTNATLAEARRHLGPGTGHLPIGRTKHIDEFFDLYEEWLAVEGRKHTPATFRHWACAAYCPAECRASVELCDPAPLRMQAHYPGAVRVRLRNTSVRPWHLRPGTSAGVHARYMILLADRDVCVRDGRAGLFDAVVRPGEQIELTLPMPGLAAGRYRLLVDVIDEQHGDFFQFGSQPLFAELEAR
jgi:protein tyrosine/serine phosphatase